MKLTGKVIRVESASTFTDKQQRIMVRIAEASDTYNELKLINSDGWKLDDEVEIFIFKKAEDVEMAEKMMRTSMESSPTVS